MYNKYTFKVITDTEHNAITKTFSMLLPDTNKTNDAMSETVKMKASTVKTIDAKR